MSQDISKKYLDSICCEDYYAFRENISDIFSKSNRTNWIIQNVEGEHVFHFYLCKNEDETIYYIHDGWYEYKDFLKNILPDLQKKKWKLIYYSIPFTYIVIHCQKERRITILDQNLILDEAMTDFWDSLIPLLSTDLDLVEKCSNKLYAKFEYSNENEREVLFGCFLDCLDSLISCIVEAYNHFKLYKNQGEINFNDTLKNLLSSEVDGNVFPKDEENIDIVKIDNYYCSNKKEIDTRYPDEIDRKQRKNVEDKGKVQSMLQLLRETINKIGWFLKKNNVVDLILGYHDIGGITELQVAFVKNIKEIPAEINEMFAKYVEKYFNIKGDGKYFAFENLVHGENGANGYYDRAGKYKKEDVLKVNWNVTGLEDGDLPIFRGKFEEYKFFKSATFDDDV